MRARPSLVLVHGSPGDGRAWTRVITQLPPDASVATPDMPGYGGAAPLPPDTAAHTQAMASAIGTTIDGCAGPVWLCGHSYGGNVALHAALDRREQVHGLLLLEPVFMRALELSGEDEVLAQARTFFAAYVERVEAAEPDAVGQMIDFWFGAGAYLKLPRPVQDFLNASAARNAKDVKASFRESISREQLASFDRPVLIAHGAVSPPLARTIATALASLLPKARVRSIAGASHAMLDTHPSDVAGVIEQLCAGNRG